MFHVMVEWLDDARTRARFALPGREEWKVEHIDALMQLLGQIREEMAPAVPDEPPQETHFLHAPRYQTALHEFSGGSLIQFRHPSLGWLPFLLPSVERKKMVDYFSVQEVEWQQRHGPGPAP